MRRGIERFAKIFGRREPEAIVSDPKLVVTDEQIPAIPGEQDLSLQVDATTAQVLAGLQTGPETDAAVEDFPLPERAEVAVDRLVVVIDDQPHKRAETAGRLMGALQGLDATSRIENPTSLLAALNMALRGNDGNQATAVMLDHRFNQNFEQWQVDPADLNQLALSMGIDFSAFMPVMHHGRDNREYYESTAVGGLYYPDSISISLLLRALGFQGKIIVVSSDPPDPIRYIERAERLRDQVSSFPAGLSVNGILLKGQLGKDILFAERVDSEGIWESDFGRDDVQILRQLLGISD